MSTYCSNIDLPEAARIIRDAPHVTIMTHAKPDGDAFGAVVAMTEALRVLNRHTTSWFMPPVPHGLRALRGADRVGILGTGAKLNKTDLVLVLDTGASSQLSPIFAQLESHLDHTLIIDHHLSGDLAARWRYVDGEAAACCEIVGQFLDLLGVPIDRSIGEALFVGIAADTGWFRFSNTRPRTHEMAARLLRVGVDHSDLYARLHQNERPEKLSLMIRALDSIQMVADGRAAVMVLRAEDFHQTGADLSETEQLVDIPQIVLTVQTVVLISEPPDASGQESPAIRISFRSKPGPVALNVAELAGRFGGGGHARAAGAKMQGDLDSVVQQVLQTLREVLPRVTAGGVTR